MTDRTQQLINMASPHASASTGERTLHDIIEALRALDYEEIRYRFEEKEIIDLCHYILFEEEK